MIAAGLLLVAVGAADVARQFFGGRSRWRRLAVSVVVVAAAGILASGALDPAWVAIQTVAASAWLLAMPGTDRRAPMSFWPVVVLAGVVAWLVVVGPAASHGWLSDGWRATATLAGVSLEKTLLAIGVGVFLLESSNIVVKVALRSEAEGEPPAPDRLGTPPVRKRVHLAGWARASSGATPSGPRRALRGGRLIGPLERLMMVGLLFAGAIALIAAFVAAKGIVRFPEIQNDESRGTQAEYFLVGSMTSWALALSAAGLLWVTGAAPGAWNISAP